MALGRALLIVLALVLLFAVGLPVLLLKALTMAVKATILVVLVLLVLGLLVGGARPRAV